MNTKHYISPVTGFHPCGTVHFVCASGTPKSVTGTVVSGGSTGSKPSGGL